MTKERKILNYTIGYIIVGLFICLIGISDVFASTYNMNYEYRQQYFNNNGSSVTQVTTTWNESLQSYVSGNIPTTSNSYGAGVSISTPIPLIQNHTYTLSLYFLDKSNIAVSSKSNIALSSTLNGAGTNYANSNFGTEMIQSVVKNGSILQFVFKATRNADFLFIPWTTTTSLSQDYIFTEINIEDLGSEGISQDDINNSLNAQKNELNASINNMGEEIKESIKDTFEECRDSVNIAYNVQYAETGNDWWSIVNVIQTDIKQGETYTISVDIDADANTIAYWNNSDGVFNTSEFNVKKGLNRYSYTFIALKNATSISQTLTKYGNGDGVVISSSKLQIQKGSVATAYEEPNKQICINKIDETNDKLDQTNQQLGDLNNNLTNDNIDDNKISNAFNDFENFIDENATISSLITLPVTLFTAILNGMQNSCTPFNLGSLYGEDLILPCIDISSYLGTRLWTMIDVIISGFAIYFISKKFIKVFNNFSSMKEGDVIDD